MSRERKNYTPEEKVAVLKRHLVEKVPVSDLCDELGLNPTVFYGWQKQLFENGAAAFEKIRRRQADRRDQKIERLEAKLAQKNEVLAELLQEHVAVLSAEQREEGAVVRYLEAGVYSPEYAAVVGGGAAAGGPLGRALQHRPLALGDRLRHACRQALGPGVGDPRRAGPEARRGPPAAATDARGSPRPCRSATPRRAPIRRDTRPRDARQSPAAGPRRAPPPGVDRASAAAPRLPRRLAGLWPSTPRTMPLA